MDRGDGHNGKQSWSLLGSGECRKVVLKAGTLLVLRRWVQHTLYTMKASLSPLAQPHSPLCTFSLRGISYDVAKSAACWASTATLFAHAACEAQRAVTGLMFLVASTGIMTLETSEECSADWRDHSGQDGTRIFRSHTT